MLRSVHRRRRSHSAAAALSACLLALTLRASARASSASPGKLRSALLCVVNRKRAANGLGALKLDRKMQKAATRHVRDMVRHDYFAHQRPGGPDLTERLRRVGWHGSAWGETIAYGCGSAGTPRATVRMWMHSPPHRAILLGRFREAGIAVLKGAPGTARSGFTYVGEFGRRRC
jgi:uncharacterized protein YkwD